MYDNAYKPFRKHVLEFKKESKAESKLPAEPRYFGMPDEHAYHGKLQRDEFADIVMSIPLLRKGIWKENRDIFKDQWNIIHKDKDKDVDDNILDIINSFNKKTDIFYKYEEAGISGNIYGDGFLEIIWDEDKDVGIDTIPPIAQSPVDLKILDAEHIYSIEKKRNYDTEYYIYKAPRIPKTFIHPGRVQHIVKKRIPGRTFGISDVYTGRKILQSILTADEQYGEFIEWTGTGVFDLLIKGASVDDLKNAESKIKKRRKINAHNEDTEWSVLNPVIFSPKEFNDYFILKLAALMDMPQYVLSGVQPGQLTGSEMGFLDYLNHIQSIRTNVFKPHIEHLYKLLLEGQGLSFDDCELDWQMSYIDETTEATILKLRAEAGSLAMDRFAITEDEYRDMLKNGITNFKGESILEKEEPAIPEPEPVKPIIPVNEKYMSKAEKVLFEIEKLKGKRELEEQDRRLKEANKKVGILDL
jgi:hypothetical protein